MQEINEERHEENVDFRVQQILQLQGIHLHNEQRMKSGKIIHYETSQVMIVL